jgi:SPP1 family predicted phage head-tail adaptor
MKPGRMDRIIEIQRATVSQDAYGEEIQTWAKVDEYWAERIDLKGSERFTAMQTAANITAIYRVRWHAGLTAEDRLIDQDSREYDIKAVIEIGRRQGFDIYVSAMAE